MKELADQLRGGVAVITGAGSGIGEGLARHAAELGMKVALADIARDRVEKVAAEIEAAGGTAIAILTDVADPASIDALAEQTYAAFGAATLLVNNAGVETLGFSWEIPASTWDRTLAININGAIHGVRAFVPRMIAAGRPAFIANTSSVGGLGMMPVQTPYILSKHAILSFSECLRLEMEVRKLPINVSVILPGPVATRIFSDSDGATDPVSDHHRQLMAEMLRAEGISSIEAARRIFPQIAAGQFWVSTHPELTQEFARNRASHLAGLTTPGLPPEVLATLGGIE